MASITPDLSERLQAALDPEIAGFFTPEFVGCSELFDRYVDETIARDLEELSLAPEFASPCSVDEALARRGYSPRAQTALSWMLEKLAADGYLAAEDGPPRRYRLIRPLPSATDAREHAAALSPACVPAFSAVAQMTAHIREFFEGRATGEDILFSPSQLSLWFDYFNNAHILYSINNLVGAVALARALPEAGPARLLEIGGGCGSAALALLERLGRQGALDRIGLYRFTEAMPTFLRRGERALRQAYPGVPFEFGRLDMNQPFGAQGVAPGSFDVVYSVNALHVGRDLGFSLAEIHAALRPGGRLVLSECIRPRPGQPIYVEYVFGFLDSFVNVVTDDVRPNHGFLTPSNWRAALSRAGFEDVRMLPEVESLARDFPSFFVGAVTARKPA